MAVTISNAAACAACDSITSLIDADATPGTLVVYEAARPANPDTAVGAQTALVTFDFGAEAFAAAVDLNSSGHATANAIEPAEAAATGTAAWFRIYDGAGVAVIDGSVTDTGGAGDLKLSSTAIVSGITVTVVSLTAAMAEGAA